VSADSSAWTDVDRARDPDRLVAGLDRLRSDPFFAEQKAKTIEQLALTGAARLLDVGCGTGADLSEMSDAAGDVYGVERSVVMLAEARRRSPSARVVVGDAAQLPFTGASFDRVNVDRVVQHLPRAADAVSEWRRILRRRGRVVMFEPDLTTARIEGADPATAAAVVAWRAATRPGAAAVKTLGDVLTAAGFAGVRVEHAVLELGDLGRADGMMGILEWGEAAEAAGALGSGAGARWRADVSNAASRAQLRYSCRYVRAIGRVA